MTVLVYIITAFFAFVSGFLTGRTGAGAVCGVCGADEARGADEAEAGNGADEAARAADAEQAAFECLLTYSAETAYSRKNQGG